jgi:glutaminase
VLWVANSVHIYARIGPIMRVVRAAAVTDPEMAAQWAANEAQRATAFRALAVMLDKRGGLNRQVDEAVDVLCALLGPEVYDVLTGRGWTAQQWERFTVESITAALLA